jgi:hypothetical protein
MLLGLAGLPGVARGVDDWGSAPWSTNAALLGWLGTYLVYPVWCLRLAAKTSRRSDDGMA